MNGVEWSGNNSIGTTDMTGVIVGIHSNALAAVIVVGIVVTYKGPHYNIFLDRLRTVLVDPFAPNLRSIRICVWHYRKAQGPLDPPRRGDVGK